MGGVIKTTLLGMIAGISRRISLPRPVVSMAIFMALALPLSTAGAAYLDQTAARLPAVSDQSYVLAVGDADGVNGPDILVANNGQSSLLLNDGAGNFTDATGASLPALGGAILAAKFVNVDGDGDLDLILINAAGSNILLINNGAGVFTDQSSARLPPDIGTGADVAVGDINADNFPDIVIANRDGQNQILINDGAGNFADETASRLPAVVDPSYGVLLVDANGDGAPDLFFANHEAQNRLYTNNNLGVFADVTGASLPAVNDGGLKATAADVDGDGDMDIIVAAGAEGAKLLLNAAGVYSAGAMPALGDYAIAVAAADIDFDGSVDIAVANAGQDRVLLNDGSGGFTDATGSLLPADASRSFGLALFDADADFDFDQVIAKPGGQNLFLANDIQVPRVLVSIAPSFIEEQDPVTVTVAAFDEDGIASTVVTVNGPGATNVNVALDSAGVGTFTPAQFGQFTVVVDVTDGASNTTTRTVVFSAVQKDTAAPVVTLSISNAAPLSGQSVLLGVAATDPSGAGIITSGIVSTGLTVNGVNVPLDSSGNATFVTGPLGLHNVVATAADKGGNVGTDSGSFTVLADTVAPVVAVTATPDPVAITNPVAVNVTASDNVAVSSLTATVTQRVPTGGGTPVPLGDVIALNGAGQGSYTAFVPGTYTIESVATDPSANSTTASTTFEATGTPDVTLPVVGLTITPPNVAIGNPVTIVVSATDDILVASVSLTINGSPVALDSSNTAVFTAPVVGTYAVVATATDPTGNSAQASGSFLAVDPATDTTPPVALLTLADPSKSPFAPENALKGQAQIFGSATDLLLSQYTLAVAKVAGNGTNGAFTTLFTGNAPVSNGVLGTIDTTLLKNGIYRVRLAVSDVNQTTVALRDYSISSDAKVGKYAITITDLRVSLSGVNITVNRRYDSRDRFGSKDFGFGWSLIVEKEGTYINNQPIGNNWVNTIGGFIVTCQTNSETLPHVTEVRFSDTEFYRFVPQVTLFNTFPLTGGFCQGTIDFVQVGGNPGASLIPLNISNAVLCGQGTCFLDDFSFNIFNPADVRLTTIDGRKFDINLSTGLGRIEDRNGNSIQISAGGIVHSSGKTINFARDAQGRITSITDPRGNALTYGYDVAGDLTTVTDRVGGVTQHVYDASHFLLQIIDPQGNPVRNNEYDADGRLIAFVDALGNRSDTVHDIANNQATVTDRTGVLSVFQYDNSGNITDATIAGQVQTYTYDSRGNRLTATNMLGFTSTFTYDANNNMTSSTDPFGNVSQFAWTGLRQPLSFTDDAGKASTFAYDAAGNLTSIKDANGNTTQTFTHDASGNPTQIDSLGGVANSSYDGAGNLTQFAQPGGAVLDFTHDANGNTLTSALTRTVGGVPVIETKTNTYDADDRLTSVTGPLGNTVSFIYDGNGRVTSMTDGRGNATTTQFDVIGRATRKTFPDGTFEAYGYDAENRVNAVTNQAGRTTFLEYGPLGHPLKATFADGSTTLRGNLPTGNAATQTDQNGNVTSYTFDANSRRTGIMDALGNTTTFVYSNTNVLESITNELGDTTSFLYDESNFGAPRLIKTTFPDGTTRQQTYDPATGRIATRTNELGNTTALGYDALGRLTTLTNAAGGVTAYALDEVSNLVSQTDVNGNTTTFEYDSLGRMTKRTLPLGQFETTAYDENGNRVSYTDFKGNTTTFAYDLNDRLILKTLPGAATVAYTYTPVGKPATITDSRGVTSFAYDLLDRVVQIDNPDATTVQYSYDAVGNRTSVTGPAGTRTYAYDALNRVSRVTDPQAGQTDYTYDAAGRVSRIDFPNLVTANMTYDSRHRLTSLKYTAADGTTVLGQYDYTHSLTGNRLSMTEATGRVVAYTYDVLERLVSENDSLTGVLSTFGYDGVSNRTSLALTGAVTATLNYSYDANDRITAAGTETYTHDANGNVTSRTDGVTDPVYSWDAQNRLVQQTGTGIPTTNFQYDDFGDLVNANTGGTETRFVMDPMDNSGVSQVLSDLDSSNNVLQSQVFGQKGLVRLRSGTTNSYAHPDGLGSIRLLTDAASAVTDSYDYDAFGNVVANTGSTNNPYLFAGERFEPNTGFYNLRARYLDPNIGRFASMDPFPGAIANPMTQHRYNYVEQNPVNRIDPTGMFSLGSVSVSMSISVGLRVGLAIGVLKEFFTVSQKAIDKAKEIAKKLNEGVLNETVERGDLGLDSQKFGDYAAEQFKKFAKKPSLDEFFKIFDLSELIHLGDGVINQSFDLAESMVNTSGKSTMAYWELHAAYWTRNLPMKDKVPGNYMNCGFNRAVQSTFGIIPITKAAKLGKSLNPGSAVMGFWLGYVNFIMLVATTVDDWGMGTVPMPPPSGNCGLPFSE